MGNEMNESSKKQQRKTEKGGWGSGHINTSGLLANLSLKKKIKIINC